MLAERTRAVAESTFAIVANGASDSPPASALRDFLVATGVRRVTTVFHPLSPEDPPRHEIVVYEDGREVSRRYVKAPSRPPLTYPLDLLIPPRVGRVDGWFAFNNLHCLRGLLARRLGRASRVVYWAVDFVPERFENSVLTGIYDRIDVLCCRRADLRVEVSPAARDGRDARHGFDRGEIAPTHVSPIGAWLDRVPTVPENGHEARRVVFIGHLVPRMGVGVMIDALGMLKRRGVPFVADIAGRGPLEDELRQQAEHSGLGDQVTFHGFISDHGKLEALLARGSVALAPYADDPDSFTRYADPSKLKSYLAAGLPILTTKVPPTAHALAAEAGAEVVAYNPAALADAVERALASPEEWRTRRAAALRYARDFDWDAIIARALSAAGFAV